MIDTDGYENTRSEIENFKDDASTGIATILEEHFGYSASHIGKAPKEWPKPGGNCSARHRKTDPKVQSKEAF